jgi:hypothetical protein
MGQPPEVTASWIDVWDKSTVKAKSCGVASEKEKKSEVEMAGGRPR